MSDIATQEENEAKFPHLKGKIVKPEIIDDGLKLASIQDKSQDFLIANHVLEHSSNPIDALLNWGRVLKIGGLLFVTVLAAHCFDRGRQLTTLEHLIEDYQVGYENLQELQERNKAHYSEWLLISEPNILTTQGLPKTKLSQGELLQQANFLAVHNSEIHFYTFSRSSFEELMKYFTNHYNMLFEIIIISGYIYETLAVLSRVSASNFVLFDTDKNLETLAKYRFSLQNSPNCRKCLKKPGFNGF